MVSTHRQCGCSDIHDTVLAFQSPVTALPMAIAHPGSGRFRIGGAGGPQFSLVAIAVALVRSRSIDIGDIEPVPRPLRSTLICLPSLVRSAEIISSAAT